MFDCLRGNKIKHLAKDGGFTLVEVMIVVGIVSLIILAASGIFLNTSKHFGFFEAANQLKTAAQESVNEIASYVYESKRLFENNTAGNDYLGILDLTGSPFLLAGSLLPVIEELGSLSPASPDFVQSSVGNTLFFAGSGVPQTLENIVDSSGTVSAVRVDIYRFHYYYLTQDNSGNIAGKGYRYNLILWKSVEYAGYNQINAAAIPDATKRSNTVTALHNNGILCAWDCSEDDVTAAFYSLTAGGSINADAAHTISQDSIDDIKMLTGISGSGFKYGVSFNTSTGFQTNKPVPQFAAASGHFPGGFEVLVVGSSGGRQVFVRLVLVSQGVGGIQVEEQIILCNVRDLW